MTGNGDPGGNGAGGRRPGRGRVRIDRPRGLGIDAVVVPAPPEDDPQDGGGFWRSGRVFVTASVVAVLILWGALYLVFRQWRVRYQERQAYGARVVVAAAEPFASIVPAGERPDSAAVRAAGCGGAAAVAAVASPWDVSPAAWRRAVAETRAMLKTLTDSNVLDVDRMRALGARVSALALGATPADARARLAALWDDAEAGAGPVVTDRHPRPDVLPPARPKAPPNAGR